MPSIPVNGTETYYERAGDGPPVVCLHGDGHDQRAWTPFADAVRESYEVISYDLRGHGRTGRTATPIASHYTFVEDLRALVDALGLDAPILVGHSFGGRIAYTYAARYPDALSRLVVLEPAPNSDGLPPVARVILPLLRLAILLVGTRRASALEQRLTPGDTDDPRADMTIPGLGMSKETYLDEASAMLDSRERRKLLGMNWEAADLSAIRVPTLALTGAESPEELTQGAATVAEQGADVRREVIPDAGHDAHLDNHAAFNRVVREFLDQGR